MPLLTYTSLVLPLYTKWLHLCGREEWKEGLHTTAMQKGHASQRMQGTCPCTLKPAKADEFATSYVCQAEGALYMGVHI